MSTFIGKLKEQAASILADNPKYDAGWVDVAAEILTKYVDYDEEFLAKFTAEQLTLVKQVLDQYSSDLQFVNMVINPELNLTQMQIAISAKSNNVSNEWITVLTNPKLHYVKANYIAQGMTEGFNLTEIIDVFKFDCDQIYEIFAGIKSNIDYKMYCDVNIPAEKMGIIRHALQLGLKVHFENGSIYCF